MSIPITVEDVKRMVGWVNHREAINPTLYANRSIFCWVNRLAAINPTYQKNSPQKHLEKINKLKTSNCDRAGYIPIPDDFSYFRCGRLYSDLDVLTEKKRRNILIFQSFFEGRTSKDECKMSCIK